MKRSIRIRLICIFLGIVIVILGICIVFNAFFLEKYYTRNKENTLISIYEDMNQAVLNGNWGKDEYPLKLEKECQTSNISLFASDEKGELYLSSNSDEGILRGLLIDRMLNRDFGGTFDSDYNGMSAGEDEEGLGRADDMVSLKETDDYVLQRVNDSRLNSGYIEMWGTLNNGCYFIMRTPLEGISESTSIANHFMLLVFLLGAVLGSVLILVFSKKITKPVKELTILSTRMAELDFDQKYKSGGQDEIGILGENFNRMSASLEKNVSELKAANLRLKKDIEIRDRQEEMRSEFIGNVSHELKTPIALIEGYAEGLKVNINSDEKSKEFYCDVIIDEAGKMNHMVRNLLCLNQLEYGNDELDIERFDISKLLKGMMSSEMFKKDGVEIRTELIVNDPQYVWGDVFLIEEVLTNYLSNAVHYVKATPRHEAALIRVSAEDKSGKVRINVYNTGDHIPAEDINRIWDKFYKVDKARTREYGGNGIGLSIVKAIMDAHNESYGVINDDDGVSFWFELDSKGEEYGSNK